ncbi:MAG: hypothetical protein RIE08_11660, partial [Acidimicrobiales bacterium]
MVEHMFAAGSGTDRDTGLGEARGSLDAAAGRLRSLDLACLDVDQLSVLAKDLESHRRVVAAASARTAAAIASHTAPPDPGRGGDGAGNGDDTSGQDDDGAGPVPPPPAGGAADAAGSDRDEANRQRRAARVAQILPAAITALDAGKITTGHIAALWFACEADPARARRDEAHLVAWARRVPVARLRQLVRNWCRHGEDPEDRAAEQDRKRGV